MPARQSSNQRAVARRAILLLEGASAQCSSMQTRCPRDLSCHADAAPRREAPMTDYTYDFVNVRMGDGIAWAALNRPEKRNAMSPALHYEMDDALARLEVDDDVRVVVVTGKGGNFSAGQDLKKFFRELENNPAERKKAAAAANRWRWERLYGYDKPTIAMVHGYCVGGAFMQLLACDFAIAADKAIKHVRTMDVAQAYDYLAEKGKAIKVADSQDSYNTGLRQFLDEKSYKPTFEPFRLDASGQRSPAAKK